MPPPVGFRLCRGNEAFLIKDLVLFAVSFYLLKEDVIRASLSAESAKADLDLTKKGELA
jgi:hypothetical protein